MPVEGRDLSSRQTKYVVKDLEIGQPINSAECSETADGVAAMTTESLTYSELGDRLGSSPEAARSLARRLRLLRKPGNDGKVRVIVDLAEIHYKPVPAR